MGVRKVYTNGNQELQIQWSEHGIHLIISSQDVDFPTEFIIETNDIWQVLEDMNIYHDAILESNKSE
jgi:hypothetical protein